MPIPAHHIYRHKNIEIDGDTMLWRYMDFAKYASIILHKNIFFCRASRLGDPYEGKLTIPDYAYIKDRMDDNKENAAWLKGWMGKAGDKYFVSCWHLAEGESAAMWSLYGLRGQSVAITARHADLVSQLPAFVKCGPVNYIDFNKDACYHAENKGEDILILSKRKSFEHEREVRFFFSNHDLVLAFGSWNDAKGASDGTGFYVPVDASGLIRNVYIDPVAPGWFVDLVRHLSDANGLPGRVKQSDLMCEPEYT